MKRDGSISGLPAYTESFGGQCKKPAITGGSPLTPTETYRRPLYTMQKPTFNEESITYITDSLVNPIIWTAR